MPSQSASPSQPVSYSARLRQLALERGTQEAVVFLDAQGSVQSLSWQALDTQVENFARVLADEGIGQGDVVGFALPNIPAHLILALAIWRRGATTLVMDPRITPEAAQSLQSRSGAKLIIAQKSAQGGLLLEELEARAALLPKAAPLPDLIACPGKIVMSGGSTGLPKLMCDQRPHARIPGQSWGQIAPALGFRMEQTQIVCAAMSHNAPFTWAQNGLFEGNRIILLERFDAKTMLDAISTYQVGFAMVVPTMMVRLLDQLSQEPSNLSSLHALYHTGAPCAAWLKEAWIKILGPERVFEMYGSGENTGQTVIAGSDWLTHRGSVGRGFATQIRIRHPQSGDLLPSGSVGEIFMLPDDPENRSNYTGPNAPSPRRDAEGYQSIGDMGWLDAEGYLYLAGRRDDVINSGGSKIHPESVEAALLSHPDIIDVAVYGLDDREWGQKVAACLVARADMQLSLEEISAFARARLSPSELPKVWHILPALPRDGFGKLRRKELQQLHEEHRRSSL